MSSIIVSNKRAILKAKVMLGSYFSVSTALTVCRDTPSRSASSACDHFRSARSTRSRFLICISLQKQPNQSRKKSAGISRRAGNSNRLETSPLPVPSNQESSEAILPEEMQSLMLPNECAATTHRGYEFFIASKPIIDHHLATSQNCGNLY